MRTQQVKKSLDLLAEDPPSTLPIEVQVEKSTAQAQALCRTGKNTEGMVILDKVEKTIPPGSNALQAKVAYNRGYCSLGSLAIARHYFEEAAALADGDSFLAASSYMNLGETLIQEHHYDAAIESLQKALVFAQALKSPLLEELTLGKLGYSYSQLGDFRESIDDSEQAERMASELGWLHDDETWLMNLGLAYQVLGIEYPGKAESSYLRALTIAKGLNDKKAAFACWNDLARMALSEHNLDKAKNYWQQEMANLSPGDPREVHAWLNEAQIAVAEKDSGKAKEILQKIDQDPRTVIALRALVESLLAQVYWTEHKSSEAERTFQQSIHTVEKELAGTKEQYWASILDNHGHRFDSYIRFLIDQGQPTRALDQAEYQRELGLVTHLDSHRPALNLSAVQHRLTTSDVILDYHVTDDESFLWVITPKHTQLFHLPSHLELHYMLDAHNNEIQGQRSIEESQAGQKLYKALIQPAEKLIPRGAHVSVVPSKILWLLNFETLVVPGPKPHYWIEDVSIQNCSSLRRVAASAQSPREPAEKQMLLIGAPQEVNPAFPTLKHASEEIEKVKSHFSPAQEQVVSGSSATPQAYLYSNPQQYRLIHFVTHGIPNEKIPMESAIVLSGTNSSYKLYARDIIAQPIHADLVTISACYGAGKRWYIAEGMVGLGWAFIRAGARQVIAALWEVDDSTTPELMNTLYTELDRGRTAADALRTAKLAMLHSSGPQRLPYYWGSLQLYTRS